MKGGNKPMTTIEEESYITRESRIIWALATADVLEEDELPVETLWDVEIDVMAASE